MLNSPALLGIDLGTSSVKVALFDLDGNTLAKSESHYPTLTPQPGWAEQQPEYWWRATRDAVQETVRETQGHLVEAIGITGQMHGAVSLDQNGKPLRPAIIWADTRSHLEVQEIEALVGSDRLIQIAGSRLATGFQAATIRWLQHHEPETWRQTQVVLTPKDYLRYCLTREFITDPSDASGTLLLDISSRGWSSLILSALDIPAERLPSIADSSTISGVLHRAAAIELGLKPDIPVAGGGGDAPVAAVAAGVIEPGATLLTLSTGSQVMTPTVSPSIDSLGRIHSWCSCLPANSPGGAWYAMGATMASGMALQWLHALLGTIHGDGDIAHTALMAANAAPGANGLVFVPYLRGERTPHMDSHARGMFLGLTADHGRASLVRAVMEGVMFAARDAYQALCTVTAPVPRIQIAGGGNRSDVWCQMAADIFALPVSRPVETVNHARADASVTGAAMLAGVAVGRFSLPDAVENWASEQEHFEPKISLKPLYDQLFAVYQSCYVKHRDDFELLGHLSDPGIASA